MLSKTNNYDALQKLLKELLQVTTEEVDTNDSRNFIKSVVYADPVPSTPLVKRTDMPAGMVFVPGAVKTFEIQHVRGECGCYPDSADVNFGEDFGYGLKAGVGIARNPSIPPM